MFKVGEKVFYPHHGAGEIQNIEEKTILGDKRTYYIIRFSVTETTIMVPADNTEELGLRYVSDIKEIKKCFEILTSKMNNVEEDWKIRYKKHQDMLKSGTILEIATVVKNLYERNKMKELSSTEKKVYNNAILMLSSEIALSTGKMIEEVKSEILRLLESAN